MSEITKEVTDDMRQAACRALNERGQGNAITIADVNAMLSAALSSRSAEAGKPVVDVREQIGGLMEWLQADPDNIHFLPADDVAKLRDWLNSPFAAPVADIEPVSVPDGDLLLCKLAEKFGAQIMWANEPDEFYHLIEFTPPTLRAMLAAAPHPTKTEAGNTAEKAIEPLSGPRFNICWTQDRKEASDKVPVVLITEQDWLRANLALSTTKTEAVDADAVIERCAQIAEGYDETETLTAPKHIAAAIRALKSGRSQP